ncbi:MULTISPECIES: hypothetical protein [Nitrosomonas]|uniref:Uncharacterized protein n=1 Tax=Nitrosomonas communis TaxID=44574 RepID=A0A5D3Y8H4_9PROT|nr:MULTISPECIES: hypothetical protein [Nitrosomonas]TYP78554.1 hypothetical protein BCL69_107111 [Nitrosomonas communis]UVS60085.1 hypothetical protein NX761_11135 [Nitrosomonas sp. PLL12]
MLHGTLSGPATKKLIERAYLIFNETRFERLATIFPFRMLVIFGLTVRGSVAYAYR